MLHPYFCRVIREAVMTLGKASDRIDIRRLQRFLPRLFVKGGADPINVGRGVKIEVDLAEAEGFWFH